ncbi:MAG: ABC transporter ATP-binding protein [Calditrichia bacterium]
MFEIHADQIAQKFNQRIIFRDISFKIKSGHSLVFLGPNGSGKTTLVRVICQLIRPTKGKVRFFRNDEEIKQDQIYPFLGLVGPYLQLYNSLTALENYEFFAKIRRQPVDVNHFKKLMGRMGLAGREMDELRTYSSGMLHRVKYVMALIHQPEILILDEPTSNLDEKGAEIVYEIMEEQRRSKILIVATNEPEEIKFGEEQIRLAS